MKSFGSTTDISIGALSLSPAGPIKKVPVVSANANQASRPVTTTRSDDILKCSITISNTSAASAFGTKLIVVLPAGVTVIQ